MLKELVHVRQRAGEGFRRWFRDADFDLIVFYPSQGEEEILGFQLCYRKKPTEDERVFSWYKTGGYAHTQVDSGESEPLHYKKSPVLVADGVFAAETVLKKFLIAAENLPPRITEEVKTRIQGFTD